MIRNLSIGLFLLYGSTGCTTYYAQSRGQRITQQREDFMLMQEQVRHVEGQIETLRMEIERIQHQMDAMLLAATQDVEGRVGGVQSDLTHLRSELQKLKTQREQDKIEIVDKLSTRITQIVNQAGSSSGDRTTSSGYGVEHVVLAGQTLSQIASEYKVSVKVLIEANHLKDPNQIRVGDKLFIPE